jgi:MFS family permease
VPPLAGYLRSIDPQLPRPVWLLQLGGVTNSFGNGVVFPFLFIYLHEVRDFSSATSGLVLAVSSAAQLCAGVVVGPIIDGLGPRRTLAGGLVLQAIGFGFMPLVRHPWEAFALMAIEGAGSAGFWPSQSTLLSRLTPSDRRHAVFAQQRVTMNLGIGLGGLTGGLIASVSDPTSFTILFVVDGLTFLAYVAVLGLVRDPGQEPAHHDAPPASYRSVVRHRTFMALWTLNFVFVAAGYSLLNLMPQFAKDESGVSETAIGVVFFVNTAVIVIAQLPLSRWLEGRRRMRALALMPTLWVISWLMVELIGWRLDATSAAVALAVAAAIFGIGECFHGPAHQALVADIGPPHLRGRYFSVHSLSWGLGGTAGPAVGGVILGAEPFALWPLAAAACAVAAVGVLALEPYVPEHLRRIPKRDLVPPLPALAEPTPVDLAAGERG